MEREELEKEILKYQDFIENINKELEGVKKDLFNVKKELEDERKQNPAARTFRENLKILFGYWKLQFGHDQPERLEIVEEILKDIDENYSQTEPEMSREVNERDLFDENGLLKPVAGSASKKNPSLSFSDQLEMVDEIKNGKIPLANIQLVEKDNLRKFLSDDDIKKLILRSDNLPTIDRLMSIENFKKNDKEINEHIKSVITKEYTGDEFDKKYLNKFEYFNQQYEDFKNSKYFDKNNELHHDIDKNEISDAFGMHEATQKQAYFEDEMKKLIDRGYSLGVLPTECGEEMNIVQYAIKKDPHNIEFAGSDIQNDPQIQEMVREEDPAALEELIAKKPEMNHNKKHDRGMEM